MKAGSLSNLLKLQSFPFQEQYLVVFWRSKAQHFGPKVVGLYCFTRHSLPGIEYGFPAFIIEWPVGVPYPVVLTRAADESPPGYRYEESAEVVLIVHAATVLANLPQQLHPN